MEKIISLFLSYIKDWRWDKILAVALALYIILSAFFLISCGVWRRTTTYGVTESNYVKFDTIHTKSHVNIPKNYTYEE